MAVKSFGLVLGGGGARGLAHVGALRALNHLGYYPDVIVGVSMGAVVAATYALNDNWYRDLVEMDDSGFPEIPDFKTPERLGKFNNLLRAKRAVQNNYFGWGAGQHTVDWGRGVLKQLTKDKQLQDGRIPVYTSATDLHTGERVIKNDGCAVDAVYASSALAGLLPPLEDGSRLLIDGGYSDAAPIDVVKETGVDCVIAINPGQPLTFETPKNGFDVMRRSFEINQRENARMRFEQACMVLEPRFPCSIGVMDFARKRDCVAAGSKAIRIAAPDLGQLLEI
jgi:NTE family protein